MKNSFWDRVLIFLYVLITVALTAITVLRPFGIDLFGSLMDGLSDAAPAFICKAIIIGLGAIIGLLGVYVIVAITPVRVKKSDFVTLTSGDGGQVKVALPAMREMATQAVGNIEGLQDMKVDVNGAGDSVTIDISMDVASGTHVPSLTSSIQRTVRTYIENNCGVTVKEVSVVINSVIPGTEDRLNFTPAIVDETPDYGFTPSFETDATNAETPAQAEEESEEKASETDKTEE